MSNLTCLTYFFGAAVATRYLTVIFLPSKFCLDVSLDLVADRASQYRLRINI